MDVTQGNEQRGEFEAAVDGARNLLRVRYVGDLNGKAMEAVAADLTQRLPQLRSGFTVFADFSGVSSMDFECIAPLTKLMDTLRGAGVGTLVRILPEPDRDIGINLLGIVHYRGEVKTITVDNVAEAERVLN